MSGGDAQLSGPVGGQPMTRPTRTLTPSAAPPAARLRSPILLSASQIAIHLSVSERTVKRWIVSGELRSHKLGRLRRVADEDLAAFVAPLRR